LYPNWNMLDQYLQESTEKVNIQGHIRTKLLRSEKIEQNEEKLIELVKTAIDFGASYDMAYEAATKVLQSNEAERNMVDLRKQLIKDITFDHIAGEDRGNSKDIKKKKQQIHLDEDDLRNAVANNQKDKETIYEKLVDIGSIPSEDELSKFIL